jgi:hypothetical protein
MNLEALSDLGAVAPIESLILGPSDLKGSESCFLKLVIKFLK